MASVVAGGLFNAVAFAGAGYIFHKLDKNGHEKEMKRHNLAIEKLQKDREAWYEKTVEKKNKIAELRQEVEDADNDLDSTNEALRRLRIATEDYDEHNKTEPKLSDYYQPSDEMKTYENIVTGVIGSVSGFLITKVLL